LDPRRTLLWVFIGSLGLTGALGAGAVLMPGMPNTDELLGTSFLLTVYSLAGLICAAVLAQQRFVVLTWLGIVLLALSLAGWLTLIWLDPYITYSTTELIAKPSVTATIFGVMAMHAVLLVQVPMRRSLAKIVRAGAIASAVIVGLWLTFLFWSDFNPGGDFFVRLIGAIAILGSLGTIATPILSRLEKLDQQATGDSALRGNVPVPLTCPRCAHQFDAKSNKVSRCEGCGLKITVQFEEPRCACGYLLLGLTSDTCPECGKTIPHQDHWRRAQAETPSSDPPKPPREPPVEPPVESKDENR